MLSSPLQLTGIDTGDLFDHLYGFFHRDFVATRTLLADKVYIDPRSSHREDGKERTFWHLTSRKQSWQEKKGNRWERCEARLPDYPRSERIEWVRQIIVNHGAPQVKVFYHRDPDPRKGIRLYLWAYENDFVVILQRLGKSSSFLVTSFYIDYDGKRRDFERKYHDYLSGKDMSLKGCEWF